MAGWDDVSSQVAPKSASDPWDTVSSRVDAASANPLREKDKAAIRRGDETYPGTNTPVPGFFGLLQRRMSDPIGVQDELVGGGRYVGSLAGDLIHGRMPDTAKADQAYSEGSERVRAEQEMARERLGWGGALAADIVGGFGTTGVGTLARGAVSRGARVYDAAKSGLRWGLAAGAGNAEGGPLERIEGAGIGAATGGVLGPALSEVAMPAANALGGALYRTPNATANALRTVIPGTRDNIDQRLIAQLRRDQMTPADLRAQLAQDRADATFPGGTPMDIPLTLADSGPNMRSLAYTVAAQPGPAKAEATRVLEGRQRGEDGFTSMYDRMSEATRRSLRVTRDNAVRAEDALTTGRSQAAKAAYDDFRNSGTTIPVGDILQAHAAEMADTVTSNSKISSLLDDAYAPFSHEGHALGTTQGPSLTEQARFNLAQTQLDKRIATATAAGDANAVKNLTDLKQGLSDQFAAKTKDVNLTAPSYDLTPAQFDNAKKQLDDMISTAHRAGENYRVSVLTDLKNKLVSRADEATTVATPNGDVSLYARARESYASPTQLLEAQEAGKGFQDLHPDRIGQVYNDLSTPEARQFRLGAADTLTQKYGDAGYGHNVTKFLDNPNMQNRLGAMTTGPNLDRLNAVAEQEARMSQTRNRVLQGSRTDENQQSQIDFTLMQRLGRELGKGNVPGAVGDLVTSMLRSVYRYRETDARLLARDLFSTDPATQQATIQRLEQAYGRNQTRGAVSDALRLAQTVAARTAATPRIAGNVASGSLNGNQATPSDRNALAPR